MYEEELYIGLKAVQHASVMAEEIYEESMSCVQTKKDDSPVTVSDMCAQVILILYIKKHFPEDGIISEEDTNYLDENLLCQIKDNLGTIFKDFGEECSDENIRLIICWNKHCKSGNRRWIIDPIDGTVGYISGAQYAVCLSLLDSDKNTILGILGCPRLNYKSIDGCLKGCILYGMSGRGSFEIKMSEKLCQDFYLYNEQNRISVNIKRSLRDMALCESVPEAHRKGSIPKDKVGDSELQKILDIKHVFYVHSQCKYALLARGEADIVVKTSKPSYPVEKIWDHNSGFIIVGESGGIVTDTEGKELVFSFNNELSHNKGILASNTRETHSFVLERLNRETLEHDRIV